MQALWDKCTHIIKKTVSQQNFATWISPIKLVDVEEDRIQLSVPNKFFKDWLIENYSSVIRDSLAHVIGTGVKLNFIVDTFSEEKTKATKKDTPKIRNKPTNISKESTLNHSLNPNYGFEKFVVGSSNQFAHAACMAVAEQPARNYNPLFIYGEVGLGKTHLLNAVGLHTLSLYPDKNVVYVSAEEFMNELINSIRYDKMSKFREKYRKIDSLLIDDIQFIAGKERTQEEFFHTFNALHDSGKQIVLTSDKFPKDIPKLEGRLRSRFEWGLIADIQPPDMETMIAILDKKAQENIIDLPINVAHYIVSVASDSNVREIEGLLTRIAAYSSLTGKEIDLNLVKAVLKNVLKFEEKKEISIEYIIKTVANKFNVKVIDLKSQKKSKNLVFPRQIAMFLARKFTNSSFPDIGSKVGGRDHSTVIYANNKIKKAITQDSEVKEIIEELEETLQFGT